MGQWVKSRKSNVINSSLPEEAYDNFALKQPFMDK